MEAQDENQLSFHFMDIYVFISYNHCEGRIGSFLQWWNFTMLSWKNAPNIFLHHNVMGNGYSTTIISWLHDAGHRIQVGRWSRLHRNFFFASTSAVQRSGSQTHATPCSSDHRYPFPKNCASFHLQAFYSYNFCSNCS